MKNRNADNRWNQHNQSYHRTISEIGNTSEHLRIEHTCHHIKSSTYRRRNTKIRKTQEKGLDKRCCQCSQKWSENGNPECLESRISHQPGYDHKLFVNISHSIVDQHKRYRQCINDISQKQSIETINFKELSSKQPGQKSLLSKGINNSKSISNRRKQHGKHCSKIPESCCLRLLKILWKSVHFDNYLL